MKASLSSIYSNEHYRILKFRVVGGDCSNELLRSTGLSSSATEICYIDI